MVPKAILCCVLRKTTPLKGILWPFFAFSYCLIMFPLLQCRSITPLSVAPESSSGGSASVIAPQQASSSLVLFILGSLLVILIAVLIVALTGVKLAYKANGKSKE